MTLETRIEALELRIAPSTDEWDPVNLAQRRRQEAAELENWEERVRAHARALGEDPATYLCRTRRRMMEQRLGPPVGKYALVAGRIHVVPLEPGDEEDEKITFVYRRDGNDHD